METESNQAYSFGMVAPSALHLLEMPYPSANAYAEIGETLENLAGEAVAGAWVLQRLGIQTKLDGRWLADSHQSMELLQKLDSIGLDVSRLRIEPGYHPQEEIVIADGKTRTVFGGYIKILFNERQWNIPSEEDIKSAKIILLDPFLGAESKTCAELCVKHQAPYVTCDVAPDSFIAEHAFCSIISEEFLLREKSKLLETAALQGIHVQSDSGFAEFFELYCKLCKGWVIFTFGGEPLWYSTPAKQGIARVRETFTPFKIQVKDTTGAGDSFRAGFAYGVLKGLDSRAIIRTASAIAGLVCERFPGVLQSPTREELHQFLKSH